MKLVSSRNEEVVVIKAVGLMAVPTAICPALPADGEGLTDELGESEADGDSEALGERLSELEELGESEELGEILAEGLTLEEGEDETEAEGEREADLELEKLDEWLGESEAEALALGLRLREDEALGEIEVEDDGEVEGRVKLEVTRANNRIRTAPETVNRVAVPTAPAPEPPVKVMVLVACTDQSGLVTGSLFLLVWRPICDPFCF